MFKLVSALAVPCILTHASKIASEWVLYDKNKNLEWPDQQKIQEIVNRQWKQNIVRSAAFFLVGATVVGVQHQKSLNLAVTACRLVAVGFMSYAMYISGKTASRLFEYNSRGYFEMRAKSEYASEEEDT